MDYLIREPFSVLFPIRADVIADIKTHMEANGYDDAYPVVLGIGQWTDKPVVVDGHTRTHVAAELGIKPTFITKEFATEDEALDYTIHAQLDRRDLTDAEIISLVALFDRRDEKHNEKDESGKFKPRAANGTPGKKKRSSQKTAERLNIKRAKVERARAVISGPEDIKNKVSNGELTISRAATQIRKSKEIITVFEASNRGWVRWEWNPLKPESNELDEELLNIPKSSGKKDRVLVCGNDSSDLFDEKIPKDIIRQVIKTVEKNSQWEYIFLTKNLDRLKGFTFPTGTTIGIKVPSYEAFFDVSKRLKRLVKGPLQTYKILIFLTENFGRIYSLSEKLFESEDIDWLVVGKTWNDMNEWNIGNKSNHHIIRAVETIPDYKRLFGFWNLIAGAIWSKISVFFEDSSIVRNIPKFETMSERLTTASETEEV